MPPQRTELSVRLCSQPGFGSDINQLKSLDLLFSRVQRSYNGHIKISAKIKLLIKLFKIIPKSVTREQCIMSLEAVRTRKQIPGLALPLKLNANWLVKWSSAIYKFAQF